MALKKCVELVCCSLHIVLIMWAIIMIIVHVFGLVHGGRLLCLWPQIPIVTQLKLLCTLEMADKLYVRRLVMNKAIVYYILSPDTPLPLLSQYRKK